ncbi:MAG: hypothetical protein ABSC19_13175 [Syntrophorhabdales bacterium]|jgi:hypothetical protein
MRKNLAVLFLVLVFVAVGAVVAGTVRADVLTTLTLTDMTYSDGGTATGYFTLDYPTNGTATITSFNISVTSSQFAQYWGGQQLSQ